MLTELEKERLCRLPLDPQMFDKEDWNDLQFRLMRVLEEEEIFSSYQELSLVPTPPQNGENVP
ncbi:MAG: hypothetical protein A3A98_01175 [Candidatus Staskawiczbacteria bacterium RIFCSPLOWO2_01_FULL_40_39]|uniref:Uncharacterized protein n=1 Tax=Candidatus Staskawiczbacteria bacterium RIFCSPHIGHO2_01_FULL_39_25 TaxID=1802202 RepID=A0A1G2HNS1_9BACT|nr:MAG: hypothetical protein A2730_01175 [Candidatus Staskawiczbacteria bacterium RIFCSPHIGHO2_01_FULL_39_25]OGZ73339.1 MAG: hypothetical protein A3A98_01175 [Candidatus Staskawiczbacteria bacterium RIFCSPLOWO2_01_FULL_40_39]OGZ76851.1 MAG: hypothetical protein A3I87_01900 [Candidatus Staskawiczbacteria bacterium RIFCSPLOWO2_02_FULL_39_8]